MIGTLLILGPQRPSGNLSTALAGVGVSGRVALITAGWRHDESELDALRADLRGGIGCETVHLPLYRWFDECMSGSPDLAAAWRLQRDRVLAFKALYRVRLASDFNVVQQLRARQVRNADVHDAELADAGRVLRELDARVAERLDAYRRSAGVVSEPWTHPAVAPLHARIAETLDGCAAVAVAGGHAAVLLNRLRFFGLRTLLPGMLARGGVVAAWSAGAMALTERVVLYYDDPPEGPSEPEILDRGLGLLRGRVLFPHARRRLRLDQPGRLQQLQARFGTCLGLENGALIQVQDGVWQDRSVPGSLLHLALAEGGS
jgi:hypothetical protein